MRVPITVGYLMAMIFGMGFAYWGHNWALHGLYIAGLTLIFFAGVLLAIALWPWNKEYHQPDPAYARTKKGVDMERMAFFATALTTLISALSAPSPAPISATASRSFLAENIIRYPEKTTMEYSVIGHLHIMLALIAVMITLIIGRWLDFKGILHKIAMPLMILGTIVLNLGVWGVVTPLEPVAHMIIYVGATPCHAGGADAGHLRLGQAHPPGHGRHPETDLASRSSGALVRDPLKFGPLWQMVFMNFTVSGIGIFMAVRLDEIFRVWPAREERIELTGHWHVLSAIIATIILLYYGDMIGLKGRVRKLYGWAIIILSDMAFASVTIFEMKRLFVARSRAAAAGQHGHAADGFRAGDAAGHPGDGPDLAAARPVQEERALDARKSARTSCLTEVKLMKRTTFPAPGPRLAFCLSLPAPVDLNAPVPTFETGVDPRGLGARPGRRVPVRAAQRHRSTLDYDYEIMVTDVTVSQYVDFLNAALADGTLKVDGEQIVGFYPGDEFHGVKHEVEIAAADYIFVPLE